MKNPKDVLFVTNRPNYCHRRFAESVGASFFHVKHFLPEGIPAISSIVNGRFNSRLLPESGLYFSESIMDYYPVYYKGSGRKLILLAEDTLFKLEKMSAVRRRYLLRLFNSADGFIAISDLCRQMALNYVEKPVRVAYPFPHKEFFHVESDIESKNVLFIGRNDKTKGFMQLVEAVKSLHAADSKWNLYLIGQCSDAVKRGPGIHPVGFVGGMSGYFRKCAFFVHPAEFDACPATVFEAMNAGMITLISGNIGQTKIFRDNGLGNLILENNSAECIAGKLLELSGNGKKKMSSKLRRLSMRYREPERLEIFRNQFSSLVEETA